jgi:hypothetical protein
MRFLLNINSRTIHDAASTNGRCKIGLIRDENKLIFDTYMEAKEYLPAGRKSPAPCSFCLGPNYESITALEEKK